MLATERLLTSLPITLDFDAWYIASSGWVLVIVLGLALVAFRLTLLQGGLGAPIAAVRHGHPTPAR